MELSINEEVSINERDKEVYRNNISGCSCNKCGICAISSGGSKDTGDSVLVTLRMEKLPYIQDRGYHLRRTIKKIS